MNAKSTEFSLKLSLLRVRFNSISEDDTDVVAAISLLLFVEFLELFDELLSLFFEVLPPAKNDLFSLLFAALLPM